MTQLWDAANGYMATPKLSEELRFALQTSCRFRQFADIHEAFGANRGDTVLWNVYGDTEDEAASLAEDLPMPETGFPISQASATILEEGLAVPYSGKFDALSEHPVRAIIHKVLKNNARRRFDTLAHAQFEATLLRAVGGAAGAITVTETGTPSGASSVALTFAHVKTISDTLQERNIPLFDGEHYVAIGRPTTFRPLLDDLEDVHKYTADGWNRIMNGERGRADGIRFLSQTNIASEGWASGISDAVYFFGADTITEAIAVPEQIRGKIPDDYGRGQGIAWYAMCGFGINHNDQTNSLTKAQARILKWDSAS
jgi:N4-gp56 family major capsid protein